MQSWCSVTLRYSSESFNPLTVKSKSTELGFQIFGLRPSNPESTVCLLLQGSKAQVFPLCGLWVGWDSPCLLFCFFFFALRCCFFFFVNTTEVDLGKSVETAISRPFVVATQADQRQVAVSRSGLGWRCNDWPQLVQWAKLKCLTGRLWPTGRGLTVLVQAQTLILTPVRTIVWLKLFSTKWTQTWTFIQTFNDNVVKKSDRPICPLSCSRTHTHTRARARKETHVVKGLTYGSLPCAKNTPQECSEYSSAGEC